MIIEGKLDEFLIDILGIVVGLWGIYMVYRHKLGGKVGTAVNYFVWGVVFQLGAFVYTILYGRLDLGLSAPGPTDVHHLLMAVGMVFFAVSAVKFANLLRTPSSLGDKSEKTEE